MRFWQIYECSDGRYPTAADDNAMTTQWRRRRRTTAPLVERLPCSGPFTNPGRRLAASSTPRPTHGRPPAAATPQTQIQFTLTSISRVRPSCRVVDASCDEHFWGRRRRRRGAAWIRYLRLRLTTAARRSRLQFDERRIDQQFQSIRTSSGAQSSHLNRLPLTTWRFGLSRGYRGPIRPRLVGSVQTFADTN